MTFRTLRIYALLGALAAVGRGEAQQLTVERIFSPEFQVAGVNARWAPGGGELELLETSDSARTEIWSQRIGSGERRRVLEGRTLLGSDSSSTEIEEYQWSPDRSRMLVFADAQRVWRRNTKGTYYLYERASGRLTPLSRKSGWQMFAKFSPDGRRVGFVRDNDLFVVDLGTGVETQLTHDGSEEIINGTTDWVYEEELDLRDGWRWSPDGKRIAYWRFDQSPIKPFFLIDESGLYSRPIPIRYPKAGTPNSRVRIGVLELASGSTTWMDVGQDSSAYLARMDFAESPTEVLIQRLNRHQNRLDLLLGDVTTGQTRAILTEQDAAWVEVDDELRWVNGGRQFLWTSERDGFNHVYLHARDGAVVRQLTRGSFDVTSISGVDERNGWVYYTAASPTPMERQLFRVGLNGQGTRRISTEPGTHRIDLSPDASAYVDVYSRDGVPPVSRLHSANGRVIRVLEDNAVAAAAMRGAGLTVPEPFSFTTSDGVTLNGSMIKPRDFDPSRKYPVLMNVYGGPGSQEVLDVWQGRDYLWHQLLAERGYIVATVDNRGTGGRGREFKKAVYLNLGKWEVRDQTEAARHLASLPYVDAGRIGMWGWSFGGYLTAMTVMQGGSLFKAGISVAPVTSWDLYDTIYTERFMRTPRENPTGYRESAALTHAPKLQSNFLLVHGTGDDNVHFQNTARLADALQAANKQFDLMVYPNRAHDISGGTTRTHLFTLLTDWVLENL